MSRPRVALGTGIRLLREDEEGVEIEGPVRLVPGRTVDVVPAGPGARARLAVVWTWVLVRAGTGGPVYRGVCRWV